MLRCTTAKWTALVVVVLSIANNFSLSPWTSSFPSRVLDQGIPSPDRNQRGHSVSKRHNELTLINLVSNGDLCNWEEEYIQDLISPFEYVHERSILKETLSNDNPNDILDRTFGHYRRPVFLVSSMKACNELPGGMGDFNKQMGKILDWFEGNFGRKTTVVHMSDECEQPNRRRAELFPWYSRAVVLRNHQCGEPDTKTLKVFPLGWRAGQMHQIKLQENHTISKEYSWGWAGTMKQDRREMLKAFKSKMENGFAFRATKTKRMTPAEIFSLYSRSVFVPVGRGERVLDCFRMYTALYAGAVPVVVGESEEIRWTFSFLSNGDDPELSLPIVFAPTWAAAAEKANILLQENHKLLLSGKTKNWWYDYSKGLHEDVALFLTDF